MKVWNFSKPKQIERHFLLMIAYLVSVSVSVSLAKAVGQLSCRRVAPNPYLLASVFSVLIHYKGHE